MQASVVLFLRGFIISARIEMDTDLVCWKCGGPIHGLPMPLARLAECRLCHAELHVCRLCEFYDRKVADQCREPVADSVKEKERANFCGYFQPRPHAYMPAGGSQTQAAKAGLHALFGIESKQENDKAINAADRLRRELDQLFGDDRKNNN